MNQWPLKKTFPSCLFVLFVCMFFLCPHVSGLCCIVYQCLLVFCCGTIFVTTLLVKDHTDNYLSSRSPYLSILFLLCSLCAFLFVRDCVCLRVFVYPWLCLFACYCLPVTVFVYVFLFIRDCVCLCVFVCPWLCLLVRFCLSVTVFACVFLFVRDCVWLRVCFCHHPSSQRLSRLKSGTSVIFIHIY